jgi:two-component system, sensor histidine kinase and response regulator
MGRPMATPDPSSFEHLLSSEAFDQLQAALEQTAQDTQAYVLTDAVADIPILPIHQFALADRFVVVVSKPFSALLRGQATGTIYRTELTFNPEAIDQFVAQLIEQHPNQSWCQELQEKSTQLGLNDPDWQSQFTLKLLSLLTMPAHCQPTEAALQQQIQQERLLNQVSTQIRQSLELPVILKTAVERVRQCLQVDRLVIYQLNAPTTTLLEDFALPQNHNSGQIVTKYGSVIYEARAADTIPTVMNLSDAHCFMQELRHKDWQTVEIADAIEDVETRYRSLPCLLEFLRRAQVRAKLIAPIRLQNQLWGLLIAHECMQPRRWQDSERRFLQQIAENLAIAISQAQLYAAVQQQKQTLEERVIERTQALRDAMLTAQSANRAKSEFLATVSHELRTPLACIIGMSATLQRWSQEVLTERQQNFLRTIHESGEHLLALINDILDLSQVEAGRMMLNLQPFSLTGLAQQTLKAFEGQAALQEVDLELALHGDSLREPFVADPRRVRQILFNLLSNAIKFTPAGGKVTLKVSAQPDLVIFQIKDTGVGIPQPQLPLLFQKFQQLDSSYHREYQGTGLGLALTKQLVELHSGWIEVESTVGVGSVFTVKLPVQKANAQVKLPRSTKPSFEPSQGRIVLVEPSEEHASFICDLLLAAGYQVVWILEGLAAINQLEMLLPATIILNVDLPDIDGYHLIRSLRQNPATQHLRVLAILPNGNPNSNRWQVDGADDAILQPIHPEALLQKVRTLNISRLIFQPFNRLAKLSFGQKIER